MSNIEITIEDTIYIQDILDWAHNNNEQVLDPYKYMQSRNNSITKVEFSHYIKIILSISPAVIVRPHPNVFTYRKTAYLEKYLAKGGYRAEYEKAQEKLEEERRRKDIELEGITTTIKTSKEAIELAKDSNNKAFWSNVIAIISALIALVAIIIRKKN